MKCECNLHIFIGEDHKVKVTIFLSLRSKCSTYYKFYSATSSYLDIHDLSIQKNFYVQCQTHQKQRKRNLQRSTIMASFKQNNTIWTYIGTYFNLITYVYLFGKKYMYNWISITPLNTHQSNFTWRSFLLLLTEEKTFPLVNKSGKRFFFLKFDKTWL